MHDTHTHTQTRRKSSLFSLFNFCHFHHALCANYWTDFAFGTHTEYTAREEVSSINQPTRAHFIRTFIALSLSLSKRHFHHIFPQYIKVYYNKNVHLYACVCDKNITFFSFVNRPTATTLFDGNERDVALSILCVIKILISPPLLHSLEELKTRVVFSPKLLSGDTQCKISKEKRWKKK